MENESETISTPHDSNIDRECCDILQGFPNGENKSKV